MVSCFPARPPPQPLSAPMTILHPPSSTRLSSPSPSPLGLFSRIRLVPQCSHTEALALPPPPPLWGRGDNPAHRWPSPQAASAESAQAIRVKTRIPASFIQRDADTSIRQMTSEKVGLYAVLDRVGQGLVRKQNPHQQF